MTNHELVSALKKIGELYPRFKVTELIVSYWHKSFITYSATEFDRAFDRHVEASSHAPTIADMKSLLVQIYGKRHHTKARTYPIPYTKLDFCMDMLGVKVVSDELKSLLGVTGRVTWSDIMKIANRRDGCSAKYRETLEGIYAYAVNEWNLGVRPQTRFIGTEYATPWDLDAIPDFSNVNSNFAVKYDS